MTSAALLVTLGAALVHALWNQLLSGSRDPAARSAVGMLVASVLVAPLALPGLRWDAAAWPYAGASVLLELAYFTTLAAAYRAAPMGVVYPVARGSAPVLVLAVGWVLLGERVSWSAALGVGLVVAGILLVRGVAGRVAPRHLLLAIAVGAAIAAYTLVDSVGVEHASPVAYLVVTLGATALAQLVLVGPRSALAAAWSPGERSRTVLVGLGILGAYGLVLVALTMAPAGPVAAVRETGVVMAALLLALSGRERLTVRGLLGTLAVAAGVACVVV